MYWYPCHCITDVHTAVCIPLFSGGSLIFFSLFCARKLCTCILCLLFLGLLHQNFLFLESHHLLYVPLFFDFSDHVDLWVFFLLSRWRRLGGIDESMADTDDLNFILIGAVAPIVPLASSLLTSAQVVGFFCQPKLLVLYQRKSALLTLTCFHAAFMFTVICFSYYPP